MLDNACGKFILNKLTTAKATVEGGVSVQDKRGPGRENNEGKGKREGRKRVV